ncbi:MAG: class I SAM-dependent methyltransferase, partial [Pyramidobacter sp.]|nr:class I SAM-dependent methyltransferase [Pyramidobacter sp.]
RRMMEIFEANRAYWTRRAPGYAQVNRRELGGVRQRQAWSDELCGTVARHFNGRKTQAIRVLDIGTGPGFFAALLAHAGFRVTALDLTAAMLEEARQNLGALGAVVEFCQMDAEHLDFVDGAFDAVVTRHLTWNLPHPEQAYREWTRVLVPGGLLLNYDANWYRYLHDARAREAWNEDRRRSAALSACDDNVGEGFDEMERIALHTPLSRTIRPEWDRNVLHNLGMNVSYDADVWRRVWTRDEKICMASTPLFRIAAVKR